MIALKAKVSVPVILDGKLIRETGVIVGRSRGAYRYDVRLDSGGYANDIADDRIEVLPSDAPEERTRP